MGHHHVLDVTTEVKTAVCQFMDDYRGTGRGSAIRGSVHNQRVERNWLEMWNGCINLFYDLFMSLEEQLLKPNSEEQLFALHCLFTPHIQCIETVRTTIK
ncbi:hypothetical protein HOLleu_10519 [Holothuria leucospilota]|uniref:Integrase core domain-containing protein n=1 Tax=Holothuria leucospilota TaxID=206669 RepID=A0A9Q1HEK5_HOLLE|nr:hypothetical protein HOLleu_10519 [Holothuria leucospilota]